MLRFLELFVGMIYVFMHAEYEYIDDEWFCLLVPPQSGPTRDTRDAEGAYRYTMPAVEEVILGFSG